MTKLSRLTSMMMVAALASVAANSKAVAGFMGTHKSALKPVKTDEPSASKGGRSYGRNKFGSVAAFNRVAMKRRHQARHRIACR